MSSLSPFVAGLPEFIARLPKAELHVHHVGSASPRIVAELAARHEGASPVPADPDLLADYFTFTDFAHFIEVYLSVVDLIRTPEDIWTLTYEVAREMAGQAIRYAELTLTPYTSIVRGIAAEAYCEAVEDVRRRAEQDFGVRLAWCFDIPGESGPPAADITLDAALRLRPDGLVSFGLGGPEVGVPRAQFAAHFAQARAAGLHSVPHAGEYTGAAAVWDAVRHLGAERVGHGIQAVHDPDLLAFLAEHRIPLEISPTSNLRTRSVATLADHPLAVIAAAGVPFSINSDDPPMFSTTLNQEYLVAAELLHLDEVGLAELARGAVRQSFLPEAGRSALIDEIDSYVAVTAAT
jgi:adenosine deaminase